MFTELPLRRAFREYDAFFALSRRRYVAPNFAEIRHILNMAQVRVRAGADGKGCEGMGTGRDGLWTCRALPSRTALQRTSACHPPPLTSQPCRALAATGNLSASMVSFQHLYNS